MPNTFNNAQAQLSSTSVTDVYQAPATAGNTAVVLSVLCANVNGTAAADISIIKTNSSNTIQSYLAFTIPVPADTSLEVVANKIILKAGEKLRAQASASNFINVTISALEIT
jgi:3D (Asp-Asp-Asp) domain-containing protein